MKEREGASTPATSITTTTGHGGGSEDGPRNHIQIYSRVRPLRSRLRRGRAAGNDVGSTSAEGPSTFYIRPSLKSTSSKQVLGFPMHRVDPLGMTNHQQDDYQFEFDGVFGMEAEQEEVFDKVAKPVVSSVLDGYNGTIFAYGQTGSGKTFTITGGAERYADRGLIPRSIQYIFAQLAKSAGQASTQVAISYLELYNEQGYDLLDESRQVTKLEDMARITISEDSAGVMHLKNLSVHAVASEEEALNLLFLGDTNRMIAETPSNPSSSRSHCIFVISLTTRSTTSAVVKRSKLHLVDLAGSERVARTKIDGTLLREAKYINLSLHYLEQVIIALHEKALGKRTHVPHRNSMMTCVLRDSLGGNCKTSMIATVATEDELIEESISTCRFAQRVALISNHATINQESDPYLLIAKLQREVLRLKAELAMLRGSPEGAGDEPLPDYEVQRVRAAVDEYLRAGDAGDKEALAFDDMRKIRCAFDYLRAKCAGAAGGMPDLSATLAAVARGRRAEAREEDEEASSTSTELVDMLKRRIAHRDNEIDILIGMLNAYKQRHGELHGAGGSAATATSEPGLAVHYVRQDVCMPRTPPDAHSRPPRTGDASTVQTAVATPPPTSRPTAPLAPNPAPAALPILSTEKARAFDIFKNGYPSGSWIDVTKHTLKQKYKEAKGIGQQASEIRHKMKQLKDQQAVEGLTDELRAELIHTSTSYKNSYSALKQLKSEIEHLHHLLEQARIRLTRDFEHWYLNVYLPTSAAETEAAEGSRRLLCDPVAHPAQPAHLSQAPSSLSISDVLRQYDRTNHNDRVSATSDLPPPQSAPPPTYHAAAYGDSVPIFAGERTSAAGRGLMELPALSASRKLDPLLPVDRGSTDHNTSWRSRPPSRPGSATLARQPTSLPGLPGATGARVQEDIAAFYQARDALLRSASRNSNAGASG